MKFISMLSYVLLFLFVDLVPAHSEYSNSNNCDNHGALKNETCVCYDGWRGSHCQFCRSKVRIGASSGMIHDGFGNYSIGSKCTWLIDAPNSSIVVHLEEFETECGFDYLYIYDGNSVESPLLAAFSGLMYKDAFRIKKQIVAHSGAALIHFYSDEYTSMSGFNITYRLNACPSNIPGIDCSGNGACSNGKCNCNGHWKGLACHIENCPNNCGAHENRGTCQTELGCACNPGYGGDDCSQLIVNGVWKTINTSGLIPNGTASHGSVVSKDSMYIISGESFHKGKMLYTYDFRANIWESPLVIKDPKARYAHSTVIYDDKIFLYGGICEKEGPVSELWIFDLKTTSWQNITVKITCNDTNFLCGPLKISGHTATVVTDINNRDKMVIIFGHSPLYGYLNTVQEYYFDTREWNIVHTRGFPVKGGYGHTSTWDYYTSKIYVYGGITSISELEVVLSKSMYSYDPNTKVWKLLEDAPNARVLHSATLISPALLLVFGGRASISTSDNDSTKCYRPDMMVYDVICNSWSKVSTPPNIEENLTRFGHSASHFEGSLYIYGGFDGQMLSDILKFTPGSCVHLITQSSCLNTHTGVKCVWNRKNHKCVSIEDASKTSNIALKTEENIDRIIFKKCPKNRSFISNNSLEYQKKCSSLNSCASCVQTTGKCVWYHEESLCSYESCKDENKFYINLKECPLEVAQMCRQLHTCKACHSQSQFCRWQFDKGECSANSFPSPNNQIENNNSATSSQTACPKACVEYTSCQNCTKECIWCPNKSRCVDRNAYITNFPYGQCRQYIILSSNCRSMNSNEKSECGSYSTCSQCRDDPECGWCDEGGGTGLGQCMPGGYDGPKLHTHSLVSNKCTSERWHFTTCPFCQCNGHASCRSNTSDCLPCSDLTTGQFCETCTHGYWGSPLNGGKCQRCECNDQTTQCHPETGKCYCTTKGTIGDHCEKCDSANHYQANENGSCYYDLSTNYQYTFNLSKMEDRKFTQINFQNSPEISDIAVAFNITCSKKAKLDISIKQVGIKEKQIIVGQNITTFVLWFGASEYNFGTQGNISLATFYVRVYDIRPPLWFSIYFAQYPKWQ